MYIGDILKLLCVNKDFIDTKKLIKITRRKIFQLYGDQVKFELICYAKYADIYIRMSCDEARLLGINYILDAISLKHITHFRIIEEDSPYVHH